MKKMVCGVISITLLLFTLVASASSVDAVSSASVENFYGDYALTDDALMNAINSFSGFYTIGTTNENNSPNNGFFIYAMKKHNNCYYLQLGLAQCQTKTNLLRTGEGIAMYAATPSTNEGDMTFATAGARMHFKIVTDTNVITTLSEGVAEGTMFGEVIKVLPLG